MTAQYRSTLHIAFVLAVTWLVTTIMITGSFMLILEPAQGAEQHTRTSAERLSAKVGKPLQEAQKLIGEKKYKEALAKIAEAEAVEKRTAYEDYTISEMKGFAAYNTGDLAAAAAAFSSTIDSPYMDPADRTTRLLVLSQISYQMKQYPKAVDYGNKYFQAGGDKIDGKILVGQAYYFQKDCANASQTMREAVSMAQKAGQKPQEPWYQLIMSCDYQLKNEAGVDWALTQLVKQYPSKEYWNDLLNQLLGRQGQSDALILDIYRLKRAAGVLTDPSEIMEMAEMSLHAGLPGEARSILEEGFANKILGSGNDVERQNRLLALAKQQAQEDLKSLADNEKQAAAAATGEADIKLGDAYWSYGQNDKAVEAFQRGLDKGGVKNPDLAKLHLGLALVGAGRKAEAAETFRALKGSATLSSLADLWTVAL